MLSYSQFPILQLVKLDDDGQLSPTFYCNYECLKADWKKHKVSFRNANQRKQLYRGAVLAQEIFYVVREIGFDGHLKEVVKEENGRMCMHLQRNVVSADILPLQPFPNHLFESEEDKKPVLSWLTCNESLIWMHELLEKVFEGTHWSTTLRNAVANVFVVGITLREPTELSFDVRRSQEFIYEVDETGYTDPTRHNHWLSTSTSRENSLWSTWLVLSTVSTAL